MTKASLRLRNLKADVEEVNDQVLSELGEEVSKYTRLRYPIRDTEYCLITLLIH